jgi:hypothetical protein
MRFLPVSLALAILAVVLAACHRTPEENVEVKAEKASRGLEDRYNQIRSEAENEADTAAAPYDNQADALLNQMAGNAASPARAAGANAARRP